MASAYYQEHHHSNKRKKIGHWSGWIKRSKLGGGNHSFI